MEQSGYIISTAFHSDGPIRNDIHYRNEYEIIFVESGSVDLSVGNKIYSAKQNDIILLANLEQEYLKLNCDTAFSRYCVFFHAPITDTYLRNPELLNLLKNHSDIFQHCLDVSPIRNEVIALLEKMMRCDRNAEFANDLVAAYLTELLVFVSRLYPELQTYHLSGVCRNRVLAAQKYLDEHFTEQVKIADVCKLHFISNHYMSHQFKELTGYSPKQYLTLLRLRHAAIMLHDTEMAINEIVFACGFSDINNFCKQFKKEYNCTPSEYRARK